MDMIRFNRFTIGAPWGALGINGTQRWQPPRGAGVLCELARA